jgi:hypothetical protein
LLYTGDDIIQSGYAPEELDERRSPFTGVQNEQPPKVIQGNDFEKWFEDFKKAFITTSFSLVPKNPLAVAFSQVISYAH